MRSNATVRSSTGSRAVSWARHSCAAAGVAAALAPAAVAGNVDFPRFPAISPDGDAITFSWRGDIFYAPIDADALREPTIPAKRLTNHPLDELYSTFMPDGPGRSDAIVFTSEQTGYTNLFSINTDGSDLRQITDTDRFFIPNQVAAVGAPAAGDGAGGVKVIGHSAREGDVYRPGIRPYTADLETGLIERIHDAFGLFPSASPDGRYVTFTRGSSDWDRRHYRGPDSRDVWLYDTLDGSFDRLTDWAGNDGMARWRDGDTITFLSDRELDTVNLYQADLTPEGVVEAGSIRRLTSFDGRDVQWYDVSQDGRAAVLHVWDTLYLLDLRRSAPPRELSITAAEDFRDNVRLNSVDTDVTDAALSPDGKVMAYVAYGDVFVRHLEDGAPTRRVTESLNGGHARESSLAWSPDGVRLYFSSDADGTESIYAATVSLTRSEIKERVAERLNLDENEVTVEAGAASDDDDDETTDAGPTSHDHPVQGRWSAEVRSNAALPTGGNEMTFTLIVTAGADGALDVSAEVMGTTLQGTSASFDDGAFTVIFTFLDGTPVELTGDVSGATVSGAWSAGEISGSWSATRSSEFPPPADADSSDEGDDDSEGGNDADEDSENADTKETEPRLDPERWRDAVRFDIAPIVQTQHNDQDPQPTPDGKSLSFRRTLGTVVMRDLVTDEERVLIESWDAGVDWRFSHDGHWVVWSASDLNFNDDIFIMPMDGSAEPVNLSMHPDNDRMPRLSHDGKVLAFISERRNEQYDVYRVHLDRSLDALPEVELKRYYDDAAKAAKKIDPVDPIDFEALRAAHASGEEPDDATDETESGGKGGSAKDDERPELDLDDAYLRIRRITGFEGSEWNLELTPAGDRFVFTGDPGGSAGLYSVDWKGGDRKRLTSRVSVRELSPFTGKVTYLRGGRVGTVNAAGGGDETHNIDYTMRIDLAQQASQKFREMARTLGDSFYHPTMKGLDWATLTLRYHDLAKQTRTPNEFDHVGERFLGELNASHLGVTPPEPGSDIRQPAGRLGADLTALPQGDGTVWYRVDRLIPRGPAEDTEMQLQRGDVITAIELEPIVARAPRSGIDSALKGRIGQETIVSVRRSVDDAAEPIELDLLVTPISYGAEVGLRYEDWVESNRRRVESMSDDRLGYLHIRSMGAGSLEEFERDLFAAGYGKDGLIIDVRNNPGGWITDRLLASIMAKPHAYTIPRGGGTPDDPDVKSAYPQDRLYIQRYTKPINLLINEKSFSNAEIFAHAFKTLRRGTVVGRQTYGGVISTGGFRLIDGTRVRLPFRGWFLPDGTDMENYGAEPDIDIEQTPESEVAGEDEQLEAAVRELMNRLGNADDMGTGG